MSEAQLETQDVPCTTGVDGLDDILAWGVENARRVRRVLQGVPTFIGETTEILGD